MIRRHLLLFSAWMILQSVALGAQEEPKTEPSSTPSQQPSAQPILPLEVTLKTFSDRLRQPVLVYSVGVRPAHLYARMRDGQTEVDLKVVTQLSPAVLAGAFSYVNHDVGHVVESRHWQRLVEDETVFVTLNSQAVLPPGTYSWRVEVLDRISGRTGKQERKIEIPNFQSPSTPSSLLLTRDVKPMEAGTARSEPAPDSEEEQDFDLLDSGRLRYIPEPSVLFRRGDMIHLVFHLYNPTPADFEAAARGMEIGLLRNGEPVPTAEAGGQPKSRPEDAVIEYTAWLNSSNLEPADYTVFVLLPNHEKREMPLVAESFRLLPR